MTVVQILLGAAALTIVAWLILAVRDYRALRRSRLALEARLAQVRAERWRAEWEAIEDLTDPPPPLRLESGA